MSQHHSSEARLSAGAPCSPHPESRVTEPLDSRLRGNDGSSGKTGAAPTPRQASAAATADPIALRDDERTRCEIWTRVMGYHRPVAAWNPGKRAEHADRRYYVEPGVTR